MGKFIALPVGQGDAFYLERKDFRILVDGGRSKSAISPWMNEICETNHLDVLICTHNDTDHANGVIGLLDNWKGSIKEVWLPGKWTHRLKDLLQTPHEFFRELQENTRSSAYDHSPRLADIKVDPKTENNKPNEQERGFYLDEVIDGFSDITFQYGIVESFFFNILYQKLVCDREKPCFNPLLIECIEAAQNIKKIITLASGRGCEIRFFEFDCSIQNQENEKIIPVNAKKITSFQSKKISALDYLALTVSNKESLVFYSPETDDDPAVLFTADSDLNFELPQIKPKRAPIITSPHHGSDANKKAYDSVHSWLSNQVIPIWIRSDGNFKRRPCAKFINQNTKFCTLCNCGNYVKKEVKLYSCKGNWQLGGLRKCSCK